MEGNGFDIQAVPVRVTNINFDGLKRTKGDFVARVVSQVFEAKTFGQLVESVGEAQENLRRLEVFRDVGTVIDVDKTEKSPTGDGYHVTFVVQEPGRIAASARTQMGGQAEAQVTTGLRMPNLFGRGERLEVEYSYSSTRERNTEISFMKPILAIPNASLKGSLFRTKTSNKQTLYRNSAIGSLITLHCYKTDSKLRRIHHKIEYEGTWREISPLDESTPHMVYLDCGHSFKSAFRHILTIDKRDCTIFPSRGYYVNFLQEYAGILGDINYHKFDLDVQYNFPISSGLVLQTSLRTGLITPFGDKTRKCGITDRFFSGGPYSLRGFTLRGVNSSDSCAMSVGNLSHWAAAFHVYTRLPYINRRYPVVEKCRLHFFINAGNLADKLLSENIFTCMRLAYGMGIAVGLGNFGRVELNYCWPLRYSLKDSYVHGFQVGIGVHFL